MDEAFSIRRYEPRDREAVWNLHNVALRDAEAHLGDGQWDDDLHDIEGVYLENGGEFLIGEIGAEVVAMGALKKTSPDTAEIKRMRVAPKLQRRGLGQRMLSLLEERAADFGYSPLHLDTTVQQIAARVMHAKNGYMEMDRGRIGPFECVFMEKRVGRGGE